MRGGRRIVQLDRRKGEVRDAEGVRGEVRRSPRVDSRLPRAGRRHRRRLSRLAGLGREVGRRRAGPLLHLEAIPALAKDWAVDVRGAVKLATTLSERREDAELFRLLATLRTDHAVGTVDDWRWTGPTARVRGVVHAPRIPGDAHTGAAAGVGPRLTARIGA